jgi:6-phosphogluconolactonase
MESRLCCVGSYTSEAGGAGAGVSAFLLDPDTGELRSAGALAIAAPSWLEWHPRLPVLYAACELDDGAVTAIAANTDGLRVLGAAPTGGAAACHLAVTLDGQHLLAANYGGSVAVFALDEGGGLRYRTCVVEHSGHGPVSDRQESAHPHQIVLDATSELVSVVDLGADEIRSYRWADHGVLEPATVSVFPPGTGPRQLVRSATSTRAFVLAELAAALVAVEETAPGSFEVCGAVAASGRPGRNLPSQLTLSRDGRFAYVSNRIPDTIAVFAVDAPLPVLVSEHSIGSGWPRHFAIVGDYLYAGNQHGDEVVVFAVDAASGSLTRLREQPVATPTCIAVRPAG